MKTTVDRLLAERQFARNNKDWAGSDQIRQELNNLGVEIRDTPTGQEIDPYKKPINPLYHGEPLNVGDTVSVYRTDIVPVFNPQPMYY